MDRVDAAITRIEACAAKIRAWMKTNSTCLYYITAGSWQCAPIRHTCISVVEIQRLQNADERVVSIGP